MLGAVRAYQVLLGPFLGGNCRFYPSCSHYTEEAIKRFGARRGTWLGVKRLLRCRPFGPSGYDPVPEELLRSGDHAHPLRRKHNGAEAAL